MTKKQIKMVAIAMVIIGGIGFILGIPSCFLAFCELAREFGCWTVGGVGVLSLAAGVYLLLTEHIYSTKEYHKRHDTDNPRRS
jgi:uncharacterized membrane protein HdeD (DUF308 family)